MFKLGIRLLLSRKKWFVLMCFSLSLMLISITSITTASESIKQGLKEQGYQDYGEQTLVLLNSNESSQSLANNKDVEKIGQFQLLGTVDLHDGHLATVGTMDHSAQELGRLDLIEGNFPTIENGIAIEATYLSLIDANWKVGEKRKITISGESVSVTLTGIIKDYSAKWKVPVEFEKGVNDFPNLIISEQNTITVDSKTGYLVKLKGSVKEQREKAATFYSKKGREGFENHRLFSLSLQNYDHISMVSFIFQLAILITSFLCIYSIFYFFHFGQQKKLSLLKAVGANDKNLFKIYLSQNVFIFLFGFIIAIPFIIFFHYMIIHHTFHLSHYSLSYFIPTFAIVMIWMLIVFLITIWNAVQAIKRLKKHSINESLKDVQISPYKEGTFVDRINNFSIKQIVIQAFTYPKQSLLMIVTISFSLLIIIFSIYVEKETIGLWNDNRNQYYLNSQEIYSSNTVDNLTVLTKPGLTFSLKDIEELESRSGISYIQKIPFLVDLHPVINEKFISFSLENWITQNEEIEVAFDDTYDGIYDGKQIIPNVKYRLLSEKEFLMLYPEKDYQEFKRKTILYIPNTIDDSNEILLDQSITFVRNTLDEDGRYEISEWEYDILNVYNGPFSIDLDHDYQIEEDGLIVVLDQETAMENGIFQGYNELDIYVDENVSTSQVGEIESSINKLIALTPGSLYQNIPLDFSNDARISIFVGLLGKLAFITSVILSIVSITVFVFSKYKLKKKEWGIYLSMGMKKKDVYYLLYYEMILYFILATILAVAIFSYTVLINHTENSLMYYLQYFSLSAILVFIFISLGMVALAKAIKKLSIYSLLRENE
ncbi:ABC transporter permease [Pseudogracilibacillus auburnensis]|uniref:ABC transporter permease n=1 Tax=Pseudogracilibacillus auburnensis TaxID=1494959 RepID=UPI001A97B98B|nr:ABC transporter permease [Pseudogracilibacillus auburnensis]MBO1002602.1 ABC transporter permease [Pseudogracilibacillus auburnensis]